MWPGETIFSLGDLSNVDEYLRVLSDLYYPSCELKSRQDHVQAMIKRLQAENELLNDLIDKEL